MWEVVKWEADERVPGLSCGYGLQGQFYQPGMKCQVGPRRRKLRPGGAVLRRTLRVRCESGVRLRALLGG